MSEKIKPIAIYLPQFHPIPENDKWWGKGFTEWTNVTKAKPLFKGHYQPHLPADLGFYDLRLEEARIAQEAMAKEYGIYGFCYYHYWFNGKRILHEPLDRKLKNPKEDLPFMLCWANENWTRRWDGKDYEVLIKQDFSLEDDQNHMRWLCENVFNDERYIKINNSPIFAIYRHDLLPEIKKTVSFWRKIAIEEFGFNGLYLCVMESFNRSIDPNTIQFDAVIEFSPHNLLKYDILKSKLEKKLINLKLKKNYTYSLRDYNRAVKMAIERKVPDFKLFRSVTPGWDNTARRNELATMAIGSSPENYYYWLKNIIKNFKPYSEEENFVFINAMNEWAEGNHLEPCMKYGTAYLEATKKALED